MKIAILGAAGKTGVDLVNQALKAGHHVTAFVRTEDSFTLTDPALNVVVGDARTDADLVKALSGQEAVLSVLGSMKAGDELMKRATAALVTAAHETGVNRVILMSSFLAAPNYKANFMGKLLGGMMKGMVADKSSGEDLLTKSDLDWTIVYATQLDKSPAGKPVRIVGSNETVSMSNGIARADVAQFMLAQLSSATYSKAKVVITTK